MYLPSTKLVHVYRHGRDNVTKKKTLQRRSWCNVGGDGVGEIDANTILTSFVMERWRWVETRLVETRGESRQRKMAFDDNGGEMKVAIKFMDVEKIQSFLPSERRPSTTPTTRNINFSLPNCLLRTISRSAFYKPLNGLFWLWPSIDAASSKLAHDQKIYGKRRDAS